MMMINYIHGYLHNYIMNESNSYVFTVKIRSSMNINDIIWVITNKLKHTLRIESIDYKVVDKRDTTIEHHGGE